MKKVRLLWHIGDPDREGQVIVDELVELFRFGGKVMRSMPHDISPAGIMKLLKEKPVANDKYRNWYIAGVTRARSDWLVGMNMSRAYTCQMERSEEHTSELQSLMRISYAVFCLNKKT